MFIRHHYSETDMLLCLIRVLPIQSGLPIMDPSVRALSRLDLVLVTDLFSYYISHLDILSLTKPHTYTHST